MLPDIDGIAVMRQLRDDGIAAPVLIISALGESTSGAWLACRRHDYLVKPFLSSNCWPGQALGGAVTPLSRRPSCVGDLAIDRCRAPPAGAASLFSFPREFQLLGIWFATAASSRAMLLQHVWDLHSIPRPISS
jgi:two-component system OmpR family response regulator